MLEYLVKMVKYLVKIWKYLVKKWKNLIKMRSEKENVKVSAEIQKKSNTLK